MSASARCCGCTKHGRCKNMVKIATDGSDIPFCRWHKGHTQNADEKDCGAQDICAICQEMCDPSANYIETTCGHPFHMSCWMKMYKCRETARCPLCRQLNPTPWMLPHIYTVAVLQTGLQDWELIVRENFWYDYADPEERKKFVVERVSSGVRHAQIHGAVSVTILGASRNLAEIFGDVAAFRNMIDTFTVIYGVRPNQDGGTDVTEDELAMERFLIVQIHDS